MSTRPVLPGKAKPKKAPAHPPASAIEAERRQLMNALHAVVQMLGHIVGNHIEVVLHDLAKPQSSIAAIVNGNISNRRLGNSILSGPQDDQAFEAAKQSLGESGEAAHSVVGCYPTLTRSGRPLKSSTVIFRDANGDPFAALCLNADLSIIEAAHAALGRLLQPGTGARLEPAGEPPEMDILMREIISGAVLQLGKPVNLMDKEEKIQAVQAMMQRGLFIVKGGVEHAAAALGVTRFTVYNYLEALRGRNEMPQGRKVPATRPVAPRI